MKKGLRKCWLGILTAGVVCSSALGVQFALAQGNNATAEEKQAIVSPRYIYDTSLSDGVLGVGSKIALPKATIENTLKKQDPVSAVVTILHNGEVVEGYDGAESYADDFTFSYAGEYEISYSYANSPATPKDVYVVTVSENAPIITAVERTPYIVPVGTELTKPNVSFTRNGTAIESEVNVSFPDETAYRFKTMALEESGLYQIEFKTVIKDVAYSYVKSVYAYGTNAEFTGNATPYFGAPSFEKELKQMKSYTENVNDKLSWTDGLNVSFARGDVFSYDKPIRLSEMGATDKLIQLYVKPTGKVSTYFYVDLVDVNDENNVLSTRFCSVPMTAGSDSYRTYVSTAATGINQIFVGKKDNILYVDRLTGGTYTAIDISGVKDTNIYHPYSFAYDETTKQVYTGLVNREPNLLVADLDDTETYFENVWAMKQIVGGQKGYYSKAWNGFSSDEVYVRIRAEGDFAGVLETTITKIGNYDLTPKFETLLPAPIVQHVASWVTAEESADYTAYYGAPSFENELLAMDSYAKTGEEKLSWTDGINATFKVGDIFHYPDLVDLSKLSATDKLIQVLLKPMGAATTTLYVDLIDENDPENILSVRFVSCNDDSANKERYRVYVTAAALKIGQPYTGIKVGSPNILFYNRPTGGYYTSVDVSGFNTSLYYPLGFAYDETTKQVLFGFANRTSLGVVADMDDTTTHFDSVYNGNQKIDGGQTGCFTTPWNGFSSNNVYVQVRVEGISTALDTTIIKVGAEDISGYEAQNSLAGAEKNNYVFNGKNAPYYAEPSFKNAIQNVASYNGANGINVAFNKTDILSYNAKIDLSELGVNDKIIKILLKPMGAVTTTLYVDLIDENDPENILSVRFVSCNDDAANKERYRVYVTAAALKIGQPYTGVKSGSTLFFNRPTGGYYTSADVSGFMMNLYSALEFSYDETTKQVIVGSGIVADMDDTTTFFETAYNGGEKLDGGQKGYFLTPWNGFSSNKVYLQVRADGAFEGALDTCILNIGAEDLSKTGESKTNVISNAVKIDFKGYKTDDLPNAIVGQTYRLFPYSAYDVTGRKLAVKTRIYYGNSGVQMAHDGVSFIPLKAGNYTVVHTVFDRYGYAEEKSYEIFAKSATEISPLAIETSMIASTVTTGLETELPNYSVKGGSGNISSFVELYYGEELLKTFEMGEKLAFTPVKNGVYTVKYFAVDYVGNKATATVSVTAEAQANPIFVGEAKLTEVMVDGWTYTLPELYAVDYTGAQPQTVKAKITVYDARDGFVLDGNEYIPSVASSQEVRIVYSVQTENGYAEKNYHVQVRKTKDENGIRIVEYFIGADAEISATEKSVCVTAQKSNASFRFINPLLISENDLFLGFNVPQTANEFNALHIYLTDSENPENKIKLTLYKGEAGDEKDEAFTTLTINDELVQYRVPGSFITGKAYELTYEETYRWITSSNGVKAKIEKTVNGLPFEGFAGRFVYVTFEFGSLVGEKAQINVTKLNNQNINAGITADKVQPQIAILGEYGGIADLKKEVTVRNALAGDVLSTGVKLTVTVTGPSGAGTIVTKDGTPLKDLDGTVEHVFVPTHYGTYRVTFTAECGGYKATKSYNISVVDNTGPNISLGGEIPTVLQLKNGKATLTVPQIVATDDGGKECRVVVNLKRPDGTMIRIEENKVVLTATGKYVLYVDAYDANGNLTVESFTIWVA